MQVLRVTCQDVVEAYRTVCSVFRDRKIKPVANIRSELVITGEEP